MRVLLAIALFAAGIWTGWWFFAAHVIDTGVADWRQDQLRHGVQVDYSDLHVQGFPHLLDMTATDPRLTGIRSGASWHAPYFRLFAPAYQPNHVVAQWPQDQTITTRAQQITVQNDTMTADILLAPTLSLALEHIGFEADQIHLISDDGWDLRVEESRVRIRPNTDASAPYAHDISLRLSRLTPGGRLRTQLDPAERLPSLIDEVTLQATLRFDAPLDRHALSGRRPEIQGITLQDTGGHWGGADLRLSGTLEMDALGYANGRLRLRLTGWQPILDLAISTGLVPENRRSTVERAIRLLEGTSVNNRELDIPLTVTQGQVSLSVIPLTTLPPVPRY